MLGDRSAWRLTPARRECRPAGRGTVCVDVQPFDFDGQQVRTVVLEGEPWWVHNDVCRCLEIVDMPQAAERLDDDERGWVLLPESAGKQRIRVVNESGLYTLILRSKTEASKRFKRWVTHEVLPAIRKTGAFELPNVAPVGQAVPQSYSAALRAHADEVDRRLAAEARAAAAVQQTIELEGVLGPPAQAWSTMADTKRDFSVGDAAKILSRDPGISTGEIRLFRSLVSMELIFRAKDERGRPVYKPYQEHVDAGRLALRMGSTWENPKTLEREAGSPQLRVTAKGLLYLHKRMGGTGALELPADAGTALATVGA